MHFLFMLMLLFKLRVENFSIDQINEQLICFEAKINELKRDIETQKEQEGDETNVKRQKTENKTNNASEHNQPY